MEQRALDDLVHDLILNLLFVLARERRETAAPPGLLVGRLQRGLILGQVDRVPVDLEHDIGTTVRPPSGDAHPHVEDQPADEADGQDVEDPLGVFAHGAEHEGEISVRKGTEGA